MGFRVRETGEYLLTDFAVRDRFKGQINPTTLLTSEIIENLGLDPVFEGPQAVPQDHYDSVKDFIAYGAIYRTVLEAVQDQDFEWKE